MPKISKKKSFINHKFKKILKNYYFLHNFSNELINICLVSTKCSNSYKL